VTPEPAQGFVWRYLGPGGGERGESAAFPDRESAESWLGEAWSDLLAEGVEEVVLVDRQRDRSIYRMGLREA
jgi:hypothetical protein